MPKPCEPFFCDLTWREELAAYEGRLYNRPMNRQEHELTILGEECNEVGQRVSKALRFGLQQVQQAADDKPEQNPDRLTNEERIRRELYDLLAMASRLNLLDAHENPYTGMTKFTVPTDALRAKLTKVDRYLKLAAAHGTLT